MPFYAMQGEHTLGYWQYFPKATGNIPYAPTGDRTPNSGFKDPRDGHFTIRADSIRVPYL